MFAVKREQHHWRSGKTFGMIFQSQNITKFVIKDVLNWKNHKRRIVTYVT